MQASAEYRATPLEIPNVERDGKNYSISTL
jgi:hypothetical protein